MALDYSYERGLGAPGTMIAGVDEVGRGALAGPVVAAAVILDPRRVPEGLDDSKRLSPARRAVLFDIILRDALGVALAAIPASEIDRINIRQASLRAMVRAVGGLALAPDMVLVDGHDLPPGLDRPARTIIGGDAK